MRTFAGVIAALAVAFASAASFDRSQYSVATGSNAQWPVVSSHMEDAMSSTSGIGGPSRLELPLDSISAAAFGSSSVEDIVAAQKDDFTVLRHRDFPLVSVRIKQLYKPGESPSDPNAFCDPTVASWSGYIDTEHGGKSLWFYFFESRSDPAKDPVIMWTNGGPGCSSSLGLFMELGPCRVPEQGGKRSAGPPINGTTWHPHSWTNRASVFFIDQPVGVGYSYSKTGQHVYTTEQGGKDVYAFLRVFFSAFDRFQDNDFYMAGESYGGRYIPIFASEVADRNHDIEQKAIRAGHKVDSNELIKLKGVLIGNGLTDVSKQMSGYYDMTCTRRGNTGQDPLLSIETCKRMSTWVPKCQKATAQHCVASYNADLCEMWLDKCDGEVMSPYFETGQNPYNIADPCKAGLEPNLCYNVTEDIRAYLDRDDVRTLVGAASTAEIGTFKSCNMDVNQGFVSNLDSVHDNGYNVGALLERGIRALIYVGTLDWICNWQGNLRWVETLDWSGNDEWHKASNYEWIVDGAKAGQTQSGGGLTWATVYRAGHMVPYDQPEAALSMLNRWLDGEDL